MYKPRLVIEISYEQFHKLQKYIPWGVRRAIFVSIIDDLIEAFEDKSIDNNHLVAMILQKAVKLKLLVRSENVDKPVNPTPGAIDLWSADRHD